VNGHQLKVFLDEQCAGEEIVGVNFVDPIIANNN